MFSRSSLLHLRIPFSFFLLPVFLFALAVSPNINGQRILIVFLALHIFLYPASNAYNSYFDKDEGSIGGLKNPPRVSVGLYYLALLFDVIAIGLGLLISWQFAFMMFVYGLVSKAYSHPVIRLKKYAFLSWFVAGFFQGAFTFVMAYVGLNAFPMGFTLKTSVMYPAMLTSMLLWGSYPMTQIYQHQEDERRGDRTLSRVLGILGTFHFTAAMFAISAAGYYFYFATYHQQRYGLLFLVILVPVMAFFGWWYIRVRQHTEKADYTHTMWLNFLSALLLNGFFVYFFLDSSQVLQAIRAGY